MHVLRSLFLLAAVCLAGCATVTTGSDQEVRIATAPPGARCELSRNAREIAVVPQTPGTAFVAKSEHDIAINCSKPGRANGAAVLTSEGQPAALGNILFGGLLGYGVDLASGAATVYPRNVFIPLPPLVAEDIRRPAIAAP